MALLARRRVFGETLPDGRSVDEALRDLPRRPLETSPVSTENTPLMRHPSAPVPVPGGRMVAPMEMPEPTSDVSQRDFTPRGPTLADMAAPPTMIQRNNKGRPVAIIGGDNPVESNLELIRAQEGYKAPRSTKDQILSLLTGGVPGAIDYATNQKTRNRWAVGDDVANEQGQIGREMALRKSQNDLLNDQTERRYREAQAQRALREPVAREPGFTLSEGQERYDAQGNVIATRPGKPSVEKPPERNVINGTLVERQTDGTWKPVYEAPEKPDTSGFSNDLINKNISDAQAEQAKVEQALRDTAPTVKEPGYDAAGQPIMVDKPNPVYTRLENRRDTLIDDQRRMRTQMKAPTTRGQRSAAPSPSTHILSKKDWLKSHPESDWAKAVAAAKAGGYQIVQ